MPGGPACQGPAPDRKCAAPRLAHPLCPALQVIEKMEQVLEQKLRDRNEPLLDRPQGRPPGGESASPRGCVCSPAFVPSPEHLLS